MRHKVRIPDNFIQWCRKWAEQSVDGYSQGKKENSRQYARPGIAESVNAQMMGKKGEVAFALHAGLDPKITVDWGPLCDRGYDFVIATENGRKRVDVKATRSGALIWPVTKNSFLETARVDLFVLTWPVDDDQTMEIIGWVSKVDFIAKHRVAPPPPRFDAGTKYMLPEDLGDIDDLIPPPQYAESKPSLSALVRTCHQCNKPHDGTEREVWVCGFMRWLHPACEPKFMARLQ